MCLYPMNPWQMLFINQVNFFNQLIGVKPMKICHIIIGRFQPFTKAHEEILSTIFTSQIGHDPIYICYSQTHDSANPLSPIQKFKMLNIIKDSFNNMIIILQPFINKNNSYETVEMIAKEYDKVYLYAGPDRIQNYQDNFSKISNVEFIPISFFNNLCTIRASSAREYAKNNDFDKFSSIVSDLLSNDDKYNIFKTIRKYYLEHNTYSPSRRASKRVSKKELSSCRS